MLEIKKSIIVSNILDPLTKNVDDLKEVYAKLFEENKYQSIETRLIREKTLIHEFNQNRQANTSVTYYATGELSRKGLSLCTTDANKRAEAIEFCKEVLEIGQQTKMTYLGIASGEIEANALENLELFVDSVSQLIDYIQLNNMKIKLAIEPLDQYVHKKNVIGSLDMTLRMIHKLETKSYSEKNFIITWDSAHVALNEDDFEESIKQLAKYIYKVHFANAILDRNDDQYGDYHLSFEKGFMNVETAADILNYCCKYINHPIEVACEIREKDRNHCWVLEEECECFLKQAIISCEKLQQSS